jgi:hypothetical protein
MAAPLGFKTFATGDVLTAADTNGYLMQGVWTFASAAARTSAVTSPQEGNMSYLKDTNSTEYYDGSAWVAVGASGGGMTLLSTTSMVTLQTITVSSISAAYNMLFIELIDAYPSSGGGVTVRFNSDSTANAYQAFFTEPTAASVYPTATAWYYTTGTNYGWVTGSYKNADTNAYSSMTIQNYANTSARKQLATQTSFQNNGSNESVNANMGFWNNTAAISTIAVTCAAGTWTQGSLKIWGIK